ncbi:hypothetical protein HPB50_026078 [Hyalomma asiaticum]|uniref:Uncharacterized protein n=1 Tax=Hyalomma asiaticum TaxID=266040 RepID=A0ACB7RMZ8_HYAAI|nr:hypothetical protein HPB50_026078 [Hyalomma asiaticum]
MSPLRPAYWELLVIIELMGILVYAQVPADKSRSMRFLHGIPDNISCVEILRAVKSSMPSLKPGRKRLHSSCSSTTSPFLGW